MVRVASSALSGGAVDQRIATAFRSWPGGAPEAIAGGPAAPHRGGRCARRGVHRDAEQPHGVAHPPGAVSFLRGTGVHLEMGCLSPPLPWCRAHSATWGGSLCHAIGRAWLDCGPAGDGALDASPARHGRCGAGHRESGGVGRATRTAGIGFRSVQTDAATSPGRASGFALGVGATLRHVAGSVSNRGGSGSPWTAVSGCGGWGSAGCSFVWSRSAAIRPSRRWAPPGSPAKSVAPRWHPGGASAVHRLCNGRDQEAARRNSLSCAARD